MPSEFGDPARKLKVHFLDMGGRKYGDCMFIECGSKTILIDGGHAGDQNPSDGYRSIPEQMESILGNPPPFELSLLVVTHAHSDHIGCLPTLVGPSEDDAVIRPEWALVCDPDLGWGRIESDAPFERGTDSADVLAAALREENWADVRDDNQVREFLQDAVTLEQRYRTMLERLEERGTRMVLYRPRSNLFTRLLDEFEDVGLTMLGPSLAHLNQCAKVINDEGRIARDVMDSLSSRPGDAFGDDLVRSYRIAVQGLRTDMVDAGEKGASPAVNNQSIVFYLNFRGQKILFNGDMQFSAPQTLDLDQHMLELRRQIAENGPYSLAKLPHHGSYNGADDELFDELGSTYWGMCAGVGDPGHPHSKILDILRSRRDSLRWGRTDQNGLVTFTYTGEGWEMSKKRGRFNSLAPNVEQDVAGGTSLPATAPEEFVAGTVPAVAAGEAGAGPAPPSTVSGGAATGGTGGPGVTTQSSGDVVEITARIPHTSTDVTITVSVRPQGVADGRNPPDAGGASPPSGHLGAIGNVPPPMIRVGGGRKLPKLLFATSTSALGKNIGAANVAAIVRDLQAAGHVVVDLPSTTGGVSAAQQIAAKLPASGAAGVVLLGGYDVIPPVRTDVLAPALKALVPPKTLKGDHDRFIVWSDAFYADADGDGFPDRPVSRIPDGKSIELVRTALQATWKLGSAWKGLRNVKRPFADHVFRKCSPTGALLRSEKTVVGSLAAKDVAAEQVYFMLHGARDDGTQFWGETLDGSGKTIDYPTAFHLSRIPDQAPGIVLTGCCWGALVGDPTAVNAASGTALTPRTSANSIALKYLERGALAFVGCTGEHYSPTPPGEFFGGPMHHAFWANVRGGDGPASALWKAQQAYRARIPHGPDDPSSTAVEHKILWQFTCLGLGW